MGRKPEVGNKLKQSGSKIKKNLKVKHDRTKGALREVAVSDITDRKEIEAGLEKKRNKIPGIRREYHQHHT